MKIVKVTNVRPDARQLGYSFADVTTQSGRLWWKKTAVRHVYKPPHSSYWRWTDSGEFTPGSQIESLVEAAKARAVMP